MPVSSHYRPAPRWLELGAGFQDVVEPASFPKRVLRFRNQRWAERIGLGELDAEEWERHLAGFAPLPRNLPEPLALRYHGHQFRNYNSALGDGRGFLYAQLLDAVDGRLLDLGTKGSGRTPWSRDGDGRLTLKGGVREVLATEMLEALGVYTSKTLSLVETGESLYRGDEPSPTRSSVLVRLSHSHVRFGSFQRLAALDDVERLRRLVEHAIEWHFPAIAGASAAGPPSEPASEPSPAAEGSGESAATGTIERFLRVVAERSAELCASWMAAGFVHGVLNTDNMNVTGESFDYGPYRFLPTFDLSFTAAYFDHSGLYAYGRQPQTVLWNLQRLAEALSPLAPLDGLLRVLIDFGPLFHRAWERRVLGRLGLEPFGDERDADLLSHLRAFLEESQVGYEQFFFDLYGGTAAASPARTATSPEADKYLAPTFAPLRRALDDFAPAPGALERLASPYFQRARPCTLLIDEIEALWAPIAERDDWAPLEAKLADIRAIVPPAVVGTGAPCETGR